MSGIAAVIHWHDPDVAEDLVERLLDRMPHRSTDGRALLAERYCCLGYARHAATARERQEVQPLSDPQRRLSVAADARLDNRDELHDLLVGTGRRVLSDSELLLLGYERWGSELAAHLIGDFAFVIWDSHRRELYAARDAFGMRPLYYHSTPDRLVLASEVEPILALGDVPRDVDEHSVLAYLLHTHRHHRRTFFRAVTRIAPGHALRACCGSVREARHWFPPAAELLLKRPGEYHEEFRRLFRLAVDARLDSDRPIVAQLSGGLDSSSIVCMADEIYRQDEADRPPLWLASAVYPGLDSDETPFIEPVVKSVHFPFEPYDGRNWNPADEEVFHVAHPWREARPGISTGWRRIALGLEARVVLNGMGGDELLFDDGVFSDLASRGWWRTLLREARAAPNFGFSRTTPGNWLKYAVQTAWPPPPVLRRVYRRLRPRRPIPPPTWMGPRLQELWSEPLCEELEPVTCVSHTQYFTWMNLTCPLLCRDVDMLGYLAARHGVQLCSPFLDTRLARFILAVPFKHRLPGGWTKGLLRGALADLLPPEVAQRKKKTGFATPIRQAIQANLPRYRFLAFDSRWEIAPYIERSGVQERLARLVDNSVGSAGWELWHETWDILMLEMWLRDLNSVRWPAPPPRPPCGHRLGLDPGSRPVGSIA